MTDALWYFGRGAGVSALLLFSAVVVLGTVVRSGRSLPGLPRFAVAEVHRTLSLTACGFLLLHMVTLLADPYAQLRWVDLVVPFVGDFRPFWQGLGTLAFDLVVLLVASSPLRRRIGVRVWWGLHWTAYLCWPAAVAHGLGNGTDRRSVWMLGLVALCVVTVAAAVGWRVLQGRGAGRPPVRVAPPAGLAGLR